LESLARKFGEASLMRFHLVDNILELTPGQRIVTAKNLTLGEEYLADHFPAFPVLPGVLMLEALVQSAAWLIRASSDFAHSVIVMREAKGIKYGSFLEPGQQLKITIDAVGGIDSQAELLTFKGQGERDGTNVVSGRIVLARYNLATKFPARAAIDQQMLQGYRQEFARLWPQAS
jgi:3-hydroxyacyl-[acyl-carrier-protein] dehydratase